MRSEGCELVSEDAFRGRNGYGYRCTVGEKQVILYFAGLCGKIWTISKDNIQKDIKVIIPKGRVIDELEVALLYIVFADTSVFLEGFERKYLGCFVYVVVNIRARLYEDINVS